MVNFWSNQDPDFSSHFDQRLVGPIETETIGHIVLHTTSWICLLFSLTLCYPLLKDVNKWWCFYLASQVIDCISNFLRLEWIDNESYVTQRIIMYYIRFSFLLLGYGKLATSLYLWYKYNPISSNNTTSNNDSGNNPRQIKISQFFHKFTPIYWITTLIIALLMPEEPALANGTTLCYFIYRGGAMTLMFVYSKVLYTLLIKISGWCNDKRIRKILFISIGTILFSESFPGLARGIPVVGGLNGNITGMLACLELIVTAVYNVIMTVSLFYLSNMNDIKNIFGFGQNININGDVILRESRIDTIDTATNLQKSIQIELGDGM